MDKNNPVIGQVPEKFSQRRRIPKLPLLLVAIVVGLAGAYVIFNSFAATSTQNSNCFAIPSACGYPDATNTGVPAGTSLAASGSITASTAGQVIDGKDVTGIINITANNVTVQNTRVTSNTTCGPTNACGNYEIIVQPGLSGIVIKNVELRNTTGDTCEHDIRNLGSTIQVIGSYLHGCDSNLYSVGNTTFTDDYGLSKIDISNDHIENIYFSDSTVTVNHSTLYNPVDQTAVIFGNVNGGQGGTCSNHLTVTNSLLAGGGYTFYPCGNGSSAGSSSISITSNHLARCLSTEVDSASGGHHLCKNGTDSNGYYPGDGSYGIAAYYFDKGMTWSGNIWDNNLQAVCADGSAGCGSNGSPSGPPVDTTPPTVSITAPAKSASVSGSVTVSANANDDTGVAGVQFKLDGANLGSEDTTSPYSTTWDTTQATNGTHTLTAVARDAAGNTATSSTVTVTVNNSASGGGSTGGTQTSNCFSKPSACGYPDATNTGVPAGTTLASSGSITASTNGQVIQDKDITGELVVNAPNVTLKDSKVHTSSGGSGTTAIVLNQGATNFTIENSEIYGNGSKTNAPESGIWNHYGNAGFKIVNSYVHGSPDNVEGPVDVEDSYMIVDAEYSGAHSENIYLCGTPATVNHSTLYNTSDETSLIFGDGICGSGNQVSVTNSLLAGGGWMLQPDSKGVSAPVTITNNRVGRCLGSVSQDSGGGYVCKGGADSNGYWPYGGHYGLATDTGKLTWSGNVWDNNSQTICPTQDGSGSCSSGSGGGTGGSGTDTTKPTVSITAPANGGTVSGIVTSTASASDNVGVSKVEFYVDKSSSPAMTDTASPYNYSFDSKTLGNGSHSITAKAYDAAGNTASSSVTFTVNNPDTTPPSAPTNVKATASNATTVNLSWSASTDSGTNATGVAKYNVLRGGTVIAQVAGTSYTDTNAVANTSYSYIIQAVDGAGNVSANSAAASVTTPSAGSGGTTGGTQAKNCFSKPSACGYPDPTNTGVPAGTALTASGSITASTAGQVINAKDVAGSIEIDANNVTVENTRVTLNSGSCGATNTCGNSEIRINEGVTGTVIKNVELLTAPGITCEHDIRNTSSGTVQISGSYLHGCDSNLYNVGNATVTNTYGIAKIAISTDHVENIYMSDSTLNMDHSTFFNPVGQTAVVFANVNGGSGGTCSNHVTVSNSLVAGGGFTFYPCGNGTSAGSSSTSITNNHLARCLTAPVYHSNGGNTTCQGGADANGYYPKSGNYGISEYYFSKATTWSGNVWDDNLQPVCIDGTNGCAGSNGGGTGTPDTTPPSTPSGISATAASSTQVNLSWNASTDAGGSGLAGYNVYRNGTKINSSLVTTTTYGDDTASANTTYSYKIEAVDGAGNKSSQSTAASATTPAPQDTTAPTVPGGLKATANSSTQVNLSWGDSTDKGGSGLAGYIVYRNGQQLNQSPQTATAYTDTSAQPSTTYTYQVSAVDKAGNASNKTATVSVTTPAASTSGGGSGNNGGGNDLLLGTNGVQAAEDNDAAGSPEAFKYTAVASGQAGTISLYLDSGSAATTVTAGLYSDSNGKPGSLLASGSINSPKPAAWNAITLSSKPNVTKGATYWIALLGTGGKVKFRDAASGSCSQSPSSNNLADLPASWKTGQLWQTCTLSAYVSSSSSSSGGGSSQGGAGSGSGSNGGSNSGSGSHQQPVRPRVAITVFDKHHRPAYHAQVTLYNQTVQTNQQGIAYFTNVPVGKHDVSVQYNGQVTSRTIHVKDANSSHRNDLQNIKLSMAHAAVNPFLLVIPVLALLGGALLIYRPWNSRLATVRPVEPSRIVSSEQQSAPSEAPGHHPASPGTVYSPETKNPEDKS
ncbi:MAG TPA: Ig-like domain-containing protein [Candidatus Saccharimonadales bacterium]|nr:Ig-like domain-containing protein [Candidatus Saccharimonadales bacterium]